MDDYAFATVDEYRIDTGDAATDEERVAAELSRQTGIDAGILRKIMTGRARAVSTRNLMALARFFGCSMQELIDAFSGKTE